MKLSPEATIIEIEGSDWKFTLTPEEYEAWDIYADNHLGLLNWSYERTIAMFLNHFRRGINLNNPLV